ncbi:MAG: glycosyltransferase [Actinomycetota bacterium]|nr:glycosyltransferase [Actinomycetota bacterium]
MIDVSEVDVPELPLDRLEPVIGVERTKRLLSAAETAQHAFAGRTLWNVNSTASGGGVAEMLQVLVGYTRGAGVGVRWAVIAGDPEFFAITKRIHNQIHGDPGDGGALDTAQASHYTEVTAANARLLLERVRSEDVVLLHDPQTAGLVPALRAAGAKVVWRCHIGSDVENRYTRAAWSFLGPHLAGADAMVFSRAEYVPPWLRNGNVSIIHPSIDPFSPKNQELDDETVKTILVRAGLIAGAKGASPATFTRRDGTTDQILRPADIVRAGPPPDPESPMVLQVSRWDRLKDMEGVMRGFASHAASHGDANLALVGPRVAGVADDPEGGEVLDECIAAWQAYPTEIRQRIQLVCLPMDDVDENAAIVNAVQRHAAIITQKSLAEGFGLTVAEGMWKGRPMVASAVGGIQDQVTSDSGVLLSDPSDLDAFGRSVARLLEDPQEAARLGANGRERVQENFVGDRHLLEYAELFERLLAG